MPSLALDWHTGLCPALRHRNRLAQELRNLRPPFENFGTDFRLRRSRRPSGFLARRHSSVPLVRCSVAGMDTEDSLARIVVSLKQAQTSLAIFDLAFLRDGV